MRRITVALHPFSIGSPTRILFFMGTLQSVPDTFTLSGDNVSRISQLLHLAQRHARLEQVMVGPRLQDALTELEDALSDQIAALDAAEQNDLIEAQELDEAERAPQSWFPRYRAA